MPLIKIIGVIKKVNENTNYEKEVIEVSEESFENKLGKDLIKYNDEVITILQETDFMKSFEDCVS
jgi:hypothetical protein